MAFQKKKIPASYQARDLRDAFRAAKDFARQRRQLSVERIAELLDVTPDALYKWLGDAKMPASKIAAFEHVCGCHFVSSYLAAGAGRIVVQIPDGHVPDAEEVAGLQAIIADAVAKLARCYRGECDIEETQRQLTVTLQAVAYHRGNVGKMSTPELDFCGCDDLGGQDRS